MKILIEAKRVLAILVIFLMGIVGLAVISMPTPPDSSGVEPL